MAIRPGSGRRLRRHRAVLAAALAVATAGGLGPASPAMASSTLLRLFWNADGSSVWHVETISALCLGTPAAARRWCEAAPAPRSPSCLSHNPSRLTPASLP